MRARLVGFVAAATLVLTGCPPGGGGSTSKTTGASSTVAPTTTTVATAALLCKAAAPQQIGTIADAALTEVSGLVQSRANADVIWLHNDSGDSARTFAVKTDGTTLRQYTLEGATAVDWEDMAIWPAANGDTDALLFGDIGDNGRARDDIFVYMIDEPDPATDTATSAVQTQRILYPDGAHDAEAMFVDPVSRDLFIVTKELSGQSGVYRKPGGVLSSAPTLTKIATLDLGIGQLVTGGDIAPDGSTIALRTYGAVFVFDRKPAEDLADTFSRQPCRAPAPSEQQGEAIGFDPDGRGYVTISEGNNPPVWHVAG